MFGQSFLPNCFERHGIFFGKAAAIFVFGRNRNDFAVKRADFALNFAEIGRDFRHFSDGLDAPRNFNHAQTDRRSFLKNNFRAKFLPLSVDQNAQHLRGTIFFM